MDILAAYDRWAATCDTIDNPLMALAAALLAERHSVFDGAAVLELGRGTGWPSPRSTAGPASVTSSSA